MNATTDLKTFGYKIVSLSVLSILIFSGFLFFYLIPTIETNLIKQKKDMLSAVTQTAMNIFADQQKKVLMKKISLDDAKANAVNSLKSYRYGPQNKNYFWINDLEPKMIMHPFRPDLEQRNLSDYTDPEGTFIFKEFVMLCNQFGQGYLNYDWQFNDDTKNIKPKLSFVKVFEPWGWIIGTGVYMQDIDRELNGLKKSILGASFLIVIIISVFQFLLVKRTKRLFINQLSAEKAFKESEEKYKSIVENIHIGIARTSPGEHGRHIEVNSWLANMLGYTKEELFQMPVSDLYSNNTKRIEFSHKISELGFIEQEELQLKKKDGTVLTVLATGQAILDTDKQIKFFDLILHDVTHEKHTQEEYLKNEKLNSIGTLAGGIAHDFNNILTGLYGNIALAKLDLPPDNEAIQYIEDAEQSMTRATELTQQLLTFASGGDPIKESIPIDIVIKDAANFNLSGSNIKLIMNMDEQLWTVRADKGQLSQVISNLVINGRQAMPDGGVLNILARNMELHKNEVPSLNAGKYIKIIVQDEGTGISKEYISKIFDPYFTTKQAGCGMGLATAYSILKKHNGLITVISEIGEGSEFIIYLPAYDAEQEQRETSKHVNSKSPTAKILIMDDDEQVCNITGKMIERFGYTAFSVPNGELALSRYKQEMRNNTKYDVVLMDLTIPGGMGGKEAVTKLLEIDPDAKAIVISGYSNDPVLSSFTDYGFKGMLVKPFKIDELKQALDQVFG